ncbi:hypothetical protein BDP27DRAFT_281501 [Rhodocollybia butyracea]|uniref:Nephrocystin 3-like N-terminal domain-containing protein n=1 Tax=Rhodocollybia butyracea TaxID=206335 RepID=A0A9P5PVZ6_9AGAR|nr:hypothetical protein BDP27DRAFT_281501 [Rhodocollybia butyracea]
MPAGSTIPESARPKAKSRYSKVFKSFFHRSSRSRSEEIPTKASDQVASPIAVSTTTSDPPSALSATDNINTIPRDVYQQLLPPSLTAPQQSQPGPVQKLTMLGNAGWEMMRQTLNITKELSDGFPPLKGAVTGVLFVIEYIEKVNDVQTDFGELAAMIAALNNVLGHYHNTEAELPSSVRTRLEQFIGAINLQNGAIQEKIRRGVFKRTLEAGDDTQEIVKMLRTLTAMTNLFGIDTALNTDINVEKIRFQIGTLLDETKKSGNLPVNLNDTLLPVQAALCDPDGFPEEYKHCLPGTRETTLANATEDIQKALQSTAKQKFWLTGVAGSGKSTLATSLVIALRAQGITVATFFCKRDQVDRRDPRRVIPTLAWYLATRFPEFRKSLDPELREILAGRKALPSHPAAQLESLLLRPLNHLSTLPKPPPIVILIDALDESDEVSRHLLIDALIEETATFPEQVAVVLVSRKSRDLQRKLQSLPLLLDLDRHLHDPAADHDIHLYLEDRLRDIRDQQQEEASWPSELEVSNLTERAEGLFIWAVIACNFIEQPSCREELSRLLSQTGVTVGIDDLYAYTLGSEFSKMRGKTAWVEDYRSAMGCIICSLSPLSPDDIARLIGRSLTVVKATLNILQPLLYYDESGHVRLVHASLADYLIEEERSQQLWVANQYLHLSLARGCLKVLIECSAELNVDFETSFAHLYHEAILPHMQYSSISWADHLVLAIFNDSETSQIAELIKSFLTSSFLVWLEMLSRVESVSKGVHALRLLVSWTKTRELELQNLAVDSCRFLETFRVPIQTDVYHLYLSALPWAPSGSLIANIYRKKLDPQGVKLPAIHAGLPTEWPKDYTFKSDHLEGRPEKPTDTSPPESIKTNKSDPSNEDFVIMELERFDLKGLLVFSPDGTLVALRQRKNYVYGIHALALFSWGHFFTPYRLVQWRFLQTTSSLLWSP